VPEIGDDPDGWVPAVSERRGRGEGWRTWVGRGRSWPAGPARPQGGKIEREKEKERVGQAQIDKEGAKELHSNTFEFKFEI
jgi:hypothetical protein